jgi:hypothetical protein
MSADDQIQRLSDELRRTRWEIQALRQFLAQQPAASETNIGPRLLEGITPFDERLIHEQNARIEREFGSLDRTALLEKGRYAEAAFMAFQEATGEAERLERLSYAIRCQGRPNNFQEALFSLFQHEFQRQNGSSVDAFQSWIDGHQMIVVWLTCDERCSKAVASSTTFPEDNLPVRNLFVLGHPNGTSGQFQFDANARRLYVPCSDAYEHLSQKISAAYAFITFSGAKVCLLKVDDDIRCLNPSLLFEECLPLVREAAYVGRVVDPRVTGFARCWHFGKCQDATRNTTPYGFLADRAFAEGGPGYFLNTAAVTALGKAAVYLPDVFKAGQMYEDLTVGTVLAHFGIFPTHFDCFTSGVLTSGDS